ncbi:MAG: hypothetical protein ACFFA6_16590, partial [Promethearchaeota archaeon]
QKIDQEYYNKLIEFLYEKENLISGKYKYICAQELTAFYDKSSRDNLEKILLEKLKRKSKQYFTFGALEEEIKKIAKLAGANHVSIGLVDNSHLVELKSAKSIINYTILNDGDEEKLDKIGEEIKKYLELKKYQVIIKTGLIITSAILLPDD